MVFEDFYLLGTHHPIFVEIRVRNEAEVRIKKGAAFQTRNRIGLQDVTFRFSGGSAHAKMT